MLLVVLNIIFWGLLYRTGLTNCLEDDSRKLNVLIHYSEGSRSHITALLAIGKVLAHRGHSVTYAVFEERLHQGIGYNVSLHSLGPSAVDSKSTKMRHKIKEASSHLWGEDNPKMHLEVYLNVVLMNYNRAKLALMKYLTKDLDKYPDVVMCDFGSSSCLDVVQSLGIPLVVGFQALDSMGIVSQPYLTKSLFYSPITTEGLNIIDRMYYQIGHFIQAQRVLLPLKWAMNRKKLDGGFPSRAHVAGDFQYSLALANTFHGFEAPIHLPPNFKLIGPIITPDPTLLSDDISQFLLVNPRVVYMALGTNMIVNNQEAHSLLSGIFSAINNNVIDGAIWALGNNLMEDLPETIQSGSTNLTREFLFNNKHPKFKLSKWVPQQQVLNHPSIVLHITHGGLESIMESLVAGKPMLVVPYFMDQPRNAGKVEYMSVGWFCSRFTMTAATVQDKIRGMVEDKDNQLQFNLKRLQTIAKMGNRRLDYAADLVEEHALLAMSCRPYQPYIDQSGSPPCEMIHHLPAATRMNPFVANMWDIYLILLLTFGALCYYMLQVGKLYWTRDQNTSKSVKKATGRAKLE